LLGVDIRPYALRLLQLRKTGKGFLAEFAHRLPLPEEIFDGERIRDFERLMSLLATLVQEKKLTGMTAAIHLPANMVRMQQMQIPTGLPDETIREEIHLQIAKDFPGLGDALLLDYHLETLHPSSSSTVYFVVTREDYVLQYVNCMNAAGLKVKIVDVDLYAVQRLGIELSPDLKQQMERDNLADYLLALGLAMREVPRW
jgi:type IV pilus assembly protein PilM